MTADAEAPSAPAGPIPPGGVVGILGGGQLGRMLAIAAARLGLRVHIYAPPGDAPAAEVAQAFTRGSDDYQKGLSAFARECDVVTFEFENVPVAAVDTASMFSTVRPGRRALEVSQDRLTEKGFLRSIGVATTEYRAVDGLSDLHEGLLAMGGAGFLKTRRFGYDGKGQVAIRAAHPDQLDRLARDGYAAINRAPAILEAAAAFARELSVVVARGVTGEVVAYDPAENEHRDGILRRSQTPGSITPEAAERAKEIAKTIVEALDYVGVMGVEFFEMGDGRLLVNEIAPRVHNTGHWTMEACVVDQFQQHIRAVCGWPLGDGARHSDAVMTNLIGHDVDEWARLAEKPGLAIHLYGKGETRPGRKMGHVTRLLGPKAVEE